MKKIVVTGGAGFLGANLCRKLLQEQADAEVICIDNFFTGRTCNIEDLRQDSRFSVLRHDIVDAFTSKELAQLKGVREIYNLACPASPPHYQADPVHTTMTSVLGIYHMLELARIEAARILQASTSEVYGEPEVHPQVESYRGNVNCDGIRACYDEGKRCAESLMFDYHRTYGVETKIIRIFNTYGPGMDPKDGRVVSNFILECLKGKPITIYGDGSQTRSLCYVDDLLEGMVRMMASESGFTGPVNLGNPEEQTIKAIAERIRRLTESKSEIIYQPLPEDDPTQRRPDITLAVEKLGWRPNISADEGLKHTIAYFQAFQS